MLLFFSLKRKKRLLLTEKEEIKTNIIVEPIKETKVLPTCNYPKFDHARLLEMGLGEEEAKEFVQELIHEIGNQISLIEFSINTKEYSKLETIIHGIKGASNNVGTGGISELLTEFHHYLRTHETNIDEEIIQNYFKYLLHYTKVLEQQYL